MSRENVEVVRDVMALADDARNRDQRRSLGDLIGRITNLVADDAQIDMSRRIFNPDVYHGTSGLRRLLQEIGEVWTEFRVTPERFIDAGDRVVVIEAIRGRGRNSGVAVEGRSASIWTLRDGRVIHMQARYDPEEALKAVGLQA